MLPKINDKLLFDCDKDDLEMLINNPDYRENEYLDYKEIFSFLKYEKGNAKREKAISEFRSDICSFANADGGYLVYGISDSKGMASEIVGIDIPENNTDRFELERKNNLSTILPKQPSVQFRFIHLDNGKYIVILHIQKDLYAPYYHIENQSNYKIYKRVGNGKSCVGYTEIKNMFTQSLVIEEQVQKYRQNRILYYKSLEDTEDHKYSQFMLVHIIPDTFMDSNYNKNIFILEKIEHINFDRMFLSFNCSSRSVPNVDGLRFSSYQSGEECRINNNSIVEVFQPLQQAINFGSEMDKYPNGYFASTFLWDRIEPFISRYTEVMDKIIDTKRVFVGISIIGCKDVTTEEDYYQLYKGTIDRDNLVCSPIVIEDIGNEKIVEKAIKRLEIEYALALGVKCSKTLEQLIEEVYS